MLENKLNLEEDIKTYNLLLREYQNIVLRASVYEIARDVRNDIKYIHELKKGMFTKAYFKYIVKPRKDLILD